MSLLTPEKLVAHLLPHAIVGLTVQVVYLDESVPLGLRELAQAEKNRQRAAARESFRG